MGTTAFRVKPLAGVAGAMAEWVWVTWLWGLGSWQYKWDVSSRGAPKGAGGERERGTRQRRGLGRSRRGSWVRDRAPKSCVSHDRHSAAVRPKGWGDGSECRWLLQRLSWLDECLIKGGLLPMGFSPEILACKIPAVQHLESSRCSEGNHSGAQFVQSLDVQLTPTYNAVVAAFRFKKAVQSFVHTMCTFLQLL